MLTHASLQSPRVLHGFFGRGGGVSRGIHESLNCGFGSGDDGDRVAENRRRALKKLGAPGTPLVTIRQIHSNHCAIADTLWDSDKIVEGDALVTRRKNLAIAVLAADCAPVLFFESEAAIVGAAHAGWRGAKSGILERTVREIVELGGNRSKIRAVVGPTIGPESYEVSDAFRDGFLLEDTANDRFFGPGNRAGHPMFDLPSYVVAKLNALGLENVADLGVDTLSNSEVYFSYRDSQKTGAGDYGRNLSVIALTEGA